MIAKITKSTKSGLKKGQIVPIYSDHKTKMVPQEVEFYAELLELDITKDPITFIVKAEADCRQTIFGAERWLVKVSKNFKTYRYIRYLDRNSIHNKNVSISKLNIYDDIEFNTEHIDMLQVILNDFYDKFELEFKTRSLVLLKKKSKMCIEDYGRNGCKHWRSLVELSLYHIPNQMFRKNPTKYMDFLYATVIKRETHPVVFLNYEYQKLKK